MKVNKKYIITCLMLYLFIFGVKMNGIYDVSFFASFFVVLFNIRRIFLDKYNRILVFIPILLVMYSLVISLFSGNLDYIFIFKFVRVLFSVLSISVYIRESDLSAMDLIYILLFIIILHASTIIVESTVWINLQNILKPVSGFERVPLRFRGTGFTNGYDFAGLICNFGIVVLCYSNKILVKKHLIIMGVLLCAVCLTSRVNMLIAVTLLLFVGYFSKTANMTDKRFFRIAFWIACFPILGIFLFSTEQANHFIVQILMKYNLFRDIFSKLNYTYATTNIDNIVSITYSFEPLLPLEIFFGKMFAVNSDSGYTKYIYEIGIIGIMITGIFYFTIAKHAIRVQYREQNRFNTGQIEFMIVLLTLVMTIKISCLFARHITEILMIVYSISNYKTEKALE